MKNSKRLLVLVYSFIILGFLGFFDATYLTAKHYVGGTIVCPIFGGCEKVLNSSYSQIGFVPVALLWLFYHALILILAVGFLNSNNAKFLKLAAKLSCIGFLASIFFMSVQFFIIQALCLYCVISALISTVLFILGIDIFKKTSEL